MRNRLLCLLLSVAIAGSGCSTPVPQSQLHTRNDISQLSNAIGGFKTAFGMYPPSRIKLSETGKYNLSEALDRDSVECLKKMFPRANLENIDWNGNGQIDGLEQDGDVILEGDQCLVFFLRGIQHNGFSINKQNPSTKGGTRIGPFFEFAEHRLKPNGNLASKHGYLSYHDGFQSNFYAYFCGGPHNRYGTTDCATLKVWPYAKQVTPDIVYINPNSFQILSAGKDGIFGTGTVLPNGQPWTTEEARKIDPAGADDMSNFHPKLLGVP